MRWPIIALSLCVLFGTAPSKGSAQSEKSPDLLQSPEKGGPRRLETIADGVALRKAPSDGAAILAVLPEGALMMHDGCTASWSKIWCEVRPFRSRTTGYVHGKLVRPAAGPDNTIPTGIDTSKTRARRRDFDVKADVPCAQERGQTLFTCKAASATAGGGDATVVVTFPNGFARNLFFTHGEFMRASSTMSGVGTDVDWALVDGVYEIRVDDQRFEVPSNMVFSLSP